MKIGTWWLNKEGFRRVSEGFWCVKFILNHLLVQILCFFQEDKLVCHFDMWTYTTAFHFFEICNFRRWPFDHIQAGYKCDKFPNSYSTLHRLIDDVSISKLSVRSLKCHKKCVYGEIRTTDDIMNRFLHNTTTSLNAFYAS